jgi:hypothetical protein
MRPFGVVDCHPTLVGCAIRCIPPVQIFVAPPFLLSTRLPVVLNTLFITLTFCSGMPLLLPIAFVSLCVTYWMDKVAVTRFYSKPPNMGDDLARVRQSIPFLDSARFSHHRA